MRPLWSKGIKGMTETSRAIHYSVDPAGICHLEIDVPGKSVNLISPQVLAELSESIEEIRKNPKIKGVVFLSQKRDHFIGGAEINAKEFLSNLEETLSFVEQGRSVFQKISELSVPTLAAIHGACLGGGLELALACHYRISTQHPKTRMGLPEVMLGILPAWGGTTRLPRLIGLTAGLDMLLTGKQVNSKRAERMGLVDRVISEKSVRLQADHFLSEILLGSPDKIKKIKIKRMLNQNRFKTRILEKTFLGRYFVFSQAKKNILKFSKGHYPAPLEILKIIRDGFLQSVPLALPLEQKVMQKLIRHETTRNLLHVFETRLQAGKLSPEIQSATGPTPVKKVGVLGAGAMGAGIAQWISQRGIPVRLKDVSLEAVSKGMKTINHLLQKQVSKRRITPAEKNEYLRFVSGTTTYSGFSNCDLVIEAVAERLDIKKKVFQELQAGTKDHMILATNTSSLSVFSMAETAKTPERLLGLHFFNPVARMPLVEVVRSKQTSDATLAAGVAFVKQIGKTPLIVSDSPGFLVNRILMAYANEAGLLLEEGSALESIDRSMEQFGMPMGPFTMMDVVGLDIANHTAESIRLRLNLDDRQQSRITNRLFLKKHLGIKSGKGFYHYGKTKKVNQLILDTELSEIRKSRGLKNGAEISNEEITDRLMMIMINTAAWCLETKVIEKPADVDIGLIMGAGFPPFRGGLLKYADNIGIPAVFERLDQLAGSNGSRFAPQSLIQHMKNAGTQFYS